MAKKCGFTGRKCVGKDCMLWNESLGNCVVMGISYNLYAILKLLKEK